MVVMAALRQQRSSDYADWQHEYLGRATAEWQQDRYLDVNPRAT